MGCRVDNVREICVGGIIAHVNQLYLVCEFYHGMTSQHNKLS